MDFFKAHPAATIILSLSTVGACLALCCMYWVARHTITRKNANLLGKLEEGDPLLTQFNEEHEIYYNLRCLAPVCLSFVITIAIITTFTCCLSVGTAPHQAYNSTTGV